MVGQLLVTLNRLLCPRKISLGVSGIQEGKRINQVEVTKLYLRSRIGLDFREPSNLRKSTEARGESIIF